MAPNSRKRKFPSIAQERAAQGVPARPLPASRVIRSKEDLSDYEKKAMVLDGLVNIKFHDTETIQDDARSAITDVEIDKAVDFVFRD